MKTSPFEQWKVFTVQKLKFKSVEVEFKHFPNINPFLFIFSSPPGSNIITLSSNSSLVLHFTTNSHFGPTIFLLSTNTLSPNEVSFSSLIFRNIRENELMMTLPLFITNI
ncbi:hypothetical protein BpHYR1_014051 [Brachionus plicatilis]|uniref:Uncharacterized protein n=1 Tax=Brachionus plicatilis TaxID=10195 RepID=A0A3M7T6F5_BRAPC|nr:hypothetical protein BpHYR1_014051 [Brachionus plicatilis]